MVPALLHSPHTPSLLLNLASLVSHHVSSFIAGTPLPNHDLLKRAGDVRKHDATYVVFICLIPALVLLSGVFAGLTLGYMSLDETQLNVLSISGTPEQKMYANKIKPIRKDGHRLLVTLLLANMIVNETLPVISDPVLGGGVQSVIVSTVLIVIFSEIIPQSLCTRYGLYFGAKMAGPVRLLLWTLGLVAWPVAKLLEFVLGPHHGIIYRRAELKELIAMHSSTSKHGGDLKTDTVTIIGGALDLQEKVVKQAMTPIEDVFMLSLDARLDWETLRRICATGHSRVPVFEEVEVPESALLAQGVEVEGAERSNSRNRSSPSVSSPSSIGTNKPRMVKVKKIVGILLVKQCVLLDPKDATPIRKIPLNKVPFVPNNEPLLGILDKFQEGRSHIAIVSRFSVERAVSVKEAVKSGLTQRIRNRVGMADSSGSGSEEESGSVSASSGEEEEGSGKGGPIFKRRGFGRNLKSTKESWKEEDEGVDVSMGVGDGSPHGSKRRTRFRRGHGNSKKRRGDIEMGMIGSEVMQVSKNAMEEEGDGEMGMGMGMGMGRRGSLTLPRASFGRWEQSMPADAVLTKQGAEEFLQSVDPAIMPLGIITLEDVLEELIGEEIYDEFDPQGHPDLKSFAPQSEAKPRPILTRKGSAPELAGTLLGKKLHPPQRRLSANAPNKPALTALRNLNFKGLAFSSYRSSSAPPSPTDEKAVSTIWGGDEKIPVTVQESAVDDDDDEDGGGGGIFSEDKQADEIGVAEMDVSDVAVPAYTYGTSHPGIYAPQPLKPDKPASTSIATTNPNTMSNIHSPIPSTHRIINPALILPYRNPSPSPSFEQAILVERKRRAQAGGGSSSKGTRFKSSPLNIVGGSGGGGVIVAERAKAKGGDGGDE